MESGHSFTDLYVAVQQFYAEQMKMLDGGDFEGYASTFMADGEFTHTPGRPAARTPAGIVRELREFHRRFEGRRVQRRHWFNMLGVVDKGDGTIETSMYALVVTTEGDRVPEIAPSCVVSDVLAYENGRLRTRSRVVQHDHMRSPDPAVAR
ncbi:nuclear transport factor 2 family protein [Streptomyces sp. SID7499]|uniref:Nuclear transport factor 2 family protein n=1 Tax=Streptomyces sp. SID7499 TaxID=2706086 RepID=A0A6G3WPU1_9ACTN|nr:nuclear transport factor 2 family protein [Streptomyces sp. SID7499]